ncbi:hypothetical protein NIES806_07100 [Dolichospermum compactum NIES-806]|uniref:Uncharacterized protein n=1 Tax=Dolichospermum compactum NIES-806 TaxID=1973481 RepID=A0A1Z4UZ33_9CYAN|nr:hypothetical protein NIES806_07100 [Dolichospermum compactum NIES-806]
MFSILMNLSSRKGAITLRVRVTCRRHRVGAKVMGFKVRNFILNIALPRSLSVKIKDYIQIRFAIATNVTIQ